MKPLLPAFLISVAFLRVAAASEIEFVIVSGSEVVARASDSKFLDTARGWLAAGGFEPKDVKRCLKIIHFPERKRACFAAEFEVVSIDRTGAIFTHSLWLWFDGSGALVKDADPAVLDGAIIPGSPAMSHQ